MKIHQEVQKLVGEQTPQAMNLSFLVKQGTHANKLICQVAFGAPFRKDWSRTALWELKQFSLVSPKLYHYASVICSNSGEIASNSSRPKLLKC
jgi:hypothetical protein